jgi:hypothetical protein
MIDRISALATALGTNPTDGAAGTPRRDDAVVDIAQRSFRVALLEALQRKAAHPSIDATVVSPPPLPPASPVAPTPDEPSIATTTPETMTQATSVYAAATPAPSRSIVATPMSSAEERRIIDRTAEGAGIDPAFLQALRRAENGGPGREFGVLSVPAPTYQEQARVAAESIRRNVERFAERGGQAVDPTGRYTPDFIAFFSSRYAPVGAANDPRGLNRHHARNLLRLYTEAVGSGVA